MCWSGWLLFFINLWLRIPTCCCMFSHKNLNLVWKTLAPVQVHHSALLFDIQYEYVKKSTKPIKFWLVWTVTLYSCPNFQRSDTVERVHVMVVLCKQTRACYVVMPPIGCWKNKHHSISEVDRKYVEDRGRWKALAGLRFSFLPHSLKLHALLTCSMDYISGIWLVLISSSYIKQESWYAFDTLWNLHQQLSLYEFVSLQKRCAVTGIWSYIENKWYIRITSDLQVFLNNIFGLW